MPPLAPTSARPRVTWLAATSPPITQQTLQKQRNSSPQPVMRMAWASRNGESAVNENTGHQAVAEAIMQMWGENLGIQVEIAVMDWATFRATARPLTARSLVRVGLATIRIPPRSLTSSPALPARTTAITTTRNTMRIGQSVRVRCRILSSPHGECTTRQKRSS